MRQTENHRALQTPPSPFTEAVGEHLTSCFVVLPRVCLCILCDSPCSHRGVDLTLVHFFTLHTALSVHDRADVRVSKITGEKNNNL